MISSELKNTVSFADNECIILSYWENTERLKYNENSWLDMVQEIADASLSLQTLVP